MWLDQSNGGVLRVAMTRPELVPAAPGVAAMSVQRSLRQLELEAKQGSHTPVTVEDSDTRLTENAVELGHDYADGSRYFEDTAQPPPKVGWDLLAGGPSKCQDPSVSAGWFMQGYGEVQDDYGVWRQMIPYPTTHSPIALPCAEVQ